MSDFIGVLKQDPVVLGVAIGAIILAAFVLLVLMFRPRKRDGAKKVSSSRHVEEAQRDQPPLEASPFPPQEFLQTSASASPFVPRPAVLRSDFSRGIEDWMGRRGDAAVGVIAGGAYQLLAGQGVVSKQFMPVAAGSVFELAYTVSAIGDPTNAGKANFFVGPVFFSEEGRILRSWVEQPEIRIAEGQRAGSVKSKAPDGAARVHIGIHGSFVNEGLASDGAIAFSHLELRPL